MTEPHTPAGSERRAHLAAPLRDALVVVATTLLAALAFSRFDMGERVFAATRSFEAVQLDELPGVLLVLAASLAWYASRRYRETSRELARRTAAEHRLVELLAANRRLMRESIRAAEDERKHLARELHDEAGQYLNAIKTDAIAVQKWAEGAPQQVLCATNGIVAQVERVSGVVRDMIHGLRPVGLDELGLEAALEHHIDCCQQRLPRLQLRLACEGQWSDLDEQVALAIYRIVQEGLTNVARHAAARAVDIFLIRHSASPGQEELMLRIRDDGQGADPAAQPSGLGLVGMRERIEVLGGSLQLRTSPGQGFEIQAHIPLRQTLPEAVT